MGGLRMMQAILPLVLVFETVLQARWGLVALAKVRLNLPLMLAAISAVFPVKVAVVFLVAILATLHVETHLVTQVVLPLWALVVPVNLVMLVLILAVVHVEPHLLLHIILPLTHISRALAVLVKQVMLTTSSPLQQN